MFQARISTDIDRPLLLATLLLTVIGIAFVFSATSMPSASTEHGLYLKQIAYLFLALFAGALMAAVTYRIYEGKTSYLLYAMGLGLLVLTLFFALTAPWFYFVNKANPGHARRPLHPP
jgi:cell division protein FtsW (lipid II flippase)